MPRTARLVYPRAAYHICQRGVRRMQTFFSPSDYAEYLRLLTTYAAWNALHILGYVLMPNHVHIACRPAEPRSLAATIGRTAQNYAKMVNRREGWKGSLWQGRFWSNPCDDEAMYRVLAYIELNPVRAGLVKNAADWPWTSARAHLLGTSDPVLTEQWPCDAQHWGKVLNSLVDADVDDVREALRGGRPLGSPAFVDAWECRAGRSLRLQKRGPKARADSHPDSGLCA